MSGEVSTETLDQTHVAAKPSLVDLKEDLIKQIKEDTIGQLTSGQEATGDN